MALPEIFRKLSLKFLPTLYSFNYGENKDVINQLNLNIKPGEKVGLVGRSGAGKSTLVNLLLRFHNLENGNIRIDGRDIAQRLPRPHYAAADWYGDTRLRPYFTGQLKTTFCTVILTLMKINYMPQPNKHMLARFIETLTDPFNGNVGYDAQVGERGVKLSGGQRQRIAISLGTTEKTRLS